MKIWSRISSRPVDFGDYFLVAFTLIFVSSACIWLKDSLWPAVAHCVPSSEELLTDVAQALSQSDYEQALELLGERFGYDIVACAVETFLARVKPADMNTVSVAHARAFLAKIHTQFTR